MAGPGAGRVVVVLLAAGAGRRLGAGELKVFLEIGGRSILQVAASGAASCALVDGFVVAAPPGLEDRAAAELARLGKPVTVVTGGATRHESVRAALAALPPDCDIVVCHDAARPLARPELFSKVILAVRDAPTELDGAIPSVGIADTIKRVSDDEVIATEARDGLVAAQTPQAFRAGPLVEAHRRAAEHGLVFTDDAGVIEWAGGRVRVVPGEPGNFKITTEDDRRRADASVSDTSRE